MPSTGDECQRSGRYEGHCILKSHKQEFVVAKGQAFPPCKDCKQAVNWTLQEKEPRKK